MRSANYGNKDGEWSILYLNMNTFMILLKNKLIDFIMESVVLVQQVHKNILLKINLELNF